MQRTAIVQARMNSSRLYGKVLADVSGRPMLARLIERLKLCRSIDEIVIAATRRADDDDLVRLASQCGVRWYRGEEHDVLSRYVAAAEDARADVVLRLTADCPLIDPATCDRIVDDLTESANHCDYSSNVVVRTFPRGLDAEAFFVDVLHRMNRLGTSLAAREHVTVVLRSEKPGLFVTRDVVDDRDHSRLRWTVDEPRDLELVRRLYVELALVDSRADYPTILAHVLAHPELQAINSDVTTWTPKRSW